MYTTLSLCHKHLTHAVRLAGPVTNDLLRHVAQQLAADDWRRMAPILNIRRTRLQAILRQNVGAPAWLPIYDVLLTWSKRLPQAFDRVRLGCGYIGLNQIYGIYNNTLATEQLGRATSKNTYI